MPDPVAIQLSFEGDKVKLDIADFSHQKAQLIHYIPGHPVTLYTDYSNFVKGKCGYHICAFGDRAGIPAPLDDEGKQPVYLTASVSFSQTHVTSVAPPSHIGDYNYDITDFVDPDTCSTVIGTAPGDVGFGAGCISASGHAHSVDVLLATCDSDFDCTGWSNGTCGLPECKPRTPPNCDTVDFNVCGAGGYSAGHLLTWINLISLTSASGTCSDDWSSRSIDINLDDEYLTSDLITRAIAALPDIGFPSTPFGFGQSTAFTIMSSDDTEVTLQGLKYRYALPSWPPVPVVGDVLKWDEIFTPSDGSAVTRVTQFFEWDGALHDGIDSPLEAPSTGVYLISPPTTPGVITLGNLRWVH